MVKIDFAAVQRARLARRIGSACVLRLLERGWMYWFAERSLEPGVVCVQNLESRISNLGIRIAEEQARGDVFEVDVRACLVRVL